MTQNTNPPIPEGPAHRFTNQPGAPSPSTHPGDGAGGAPVPGAAEAAAGPLPGAAGSAGSAAQGGSAPAGAYGGVYGEPAAAQQAGARNGEGDSRPSNLVLAGAGSLLAVLAFLGGTAVGHAWDGFNTQQNQGGPGGGRQFPQFPAQQGQQGQQGQVPGQGMNGQGQGTTGQGQGTVPGQPSTGTGQTQTS
jgi:hypothetical protein